MKGENFVLAFAVAAMLGLTIWLQLELLDSDPDTDQPALSHDPDYYLENFTATGMNEDGVQYVVEAERMVHYPDDGSALLDNPHVIQYEPGTAPRHVYAESGWMSGDGEEILMTGNVRVIQSLGTGEPGGVTTTDKLKLRLKERPG